MRDHIPAAGVGGRSIIAGSLVSDHQIVLSLDRSGSPRGLTVETAPAIPKGAQGVNEGSEAA